MAENSLVTEVDKTLLGWVKNGRPIVAEKSGMPAYNSEGKVLMRPISAQEMMAVLRRVGQIEKVGATDDDDLGPTVAEEAGRRSQTGRIPNFGMTA